MVYTDIIRAFKVIKKEIQECQEDLLEYKPRLRKRVLPKENQEEYIYFTYVIHICEYWITKTIRDNKKQEMEPKDDCFDIIARILRNTDWKLYSYSGYGFYPEKKLRKVLMENRKRLDLFDLFDMEIEYLERAAEYIASRLEDADELPIEYEVDDYWYKNRRA